MEKDKKTGKGCFWFIGGLIGLILPIVLIGVFSSLTHTNIALGDNPLTASIVFALAFIELPTVIIGRSLGLPIENGGAAFLVYDFNILGYILTIIIWSLIGLLIGWGIDKVQSRKIVSN